ncbi:MAG: DUF362 domain-containing protein [Candidatus Aminicenantes bacterium]|nr:DUF362 domain-containing protein [Candidatus Aminicenantes bacterium]
MARTIDRRTFLERGAKIGAAAVIAPRALARLARQTPPAASAPVIAVAGGSDYAAMTAKAVEALGGMGRFVDKGAKVALLPNVQSRHPGTFTKPEILRTVIRMAKEAGAAEVACLSSLTQQHWDGTGLSRVCLDEGAALVLVPADETHYQTVALPEGRGVREAKLMAAFFAYDAFINLPITKDHAGNKFTGTMKNLMGLNSRPANRAFHKPGWTTDPADIEYLETCIVDLNFAARPALNIVDATEIIKTNGPMGPGELLKPMKIVAGTDRVAIDAYCAGLLGFRPEEIIAIRLAAERKLGEIDLGKVRIEEVKA